MRSFSIEEKKKMLSMISWDLKLDADLLLRLLNDEIEYIEGFDKINLYRRLLTTYDWYTLMKIVPPEKLRSVLDDAVLDRLFPKDLKDKFLYARTVLRG
jgi:hypothetical protein